MITTTKDQAETIEKRMVTEADGEHLPGPSLDTSHPGNIIHGPVVASPQATASGGSPADSSLSSAATTIENSNFSTSSTKSASVYAQRAYQEARHFVGGLIQHPTESTKHFTVLRHSHGIVFYQGSNTFLAISIFADAPLPADRTIWLQNKGWTGKTGMRAKALFRVNNSWLNVTPSMAIQQDQIAPTDERAWQRDISRFQRKAPHPIRERHQLRETDVIRIPVEAGDGYFQFVLCKGDKKKVLCTSPVFRIISTSSSPSSIRGASLSTLPLEVGAWAASLYTQTTVQNVVSPVTTTLQNVVHPLMPSSKQRFLAQTAYSASGIEDQVNSNIDDANMRYAAVEDAAYQRAQGELNLEAGPAEPYPINFVARTDASATGTALPRMHLGGIPVSILQRLNGHYFGWTRTAPENRKKSGPVTESITEPGPWLQSIISVSPRVLAEQMNNVRLQQALTSITSIRFLEEVDHLPPSRLEVRIMGFIRPIEPAATSTAADAEALEEERILLEVCDASLAQSALDHPAWAPDSVPAVTGEKSVDDNKEKASFFDRSKDGYANVRMTGQRMVDRVPLHRFGVRMGTDELKDRAVAVNGFYILR